MEQNNLLTPREEFFIYDALDLCARYIECICKDGNYLHFNSRVEGDLRPELIIRIDVDNQFKDLKEGEFYNLKALGVENE